MGERSRNYSFLYINFIFEPVTYREYGNVNIIDMTTRDPNLDMTQVILPELPNMRVEKHETEPDI